VAYSKLLINQWRNKPSSCDPLSHQLALTGIGKDLCKILVVSPQAIDLPIIYDTLLRGHSKPLPAAFFGHKLNEINGFDCQIRL
jgi:hypothetical protein